ncbi:MAG: right-handed parallel beta-helix repeat-containing protein [Nitrospirae bacterium]|nr:right-handed parallel beta-helix repeat-containing protein [Nitrospirota bacterium]
MGHHTSTTAFSPGDSILFQRGETWRRGRLTIQSGSESGSITYGAYGTGPKPLFLGSAIRNLTSDWVDRGGNIWEAVTSDTYTLPFDVGNLIMSEEPQIVGWKVATKPELTTQGKFWYGITTDGLRNTVWMYSTSNPATYYNGNIEIAMQYASHYMFDTSSKSYVIFENLFLKYAGSGVAIGGGSTHHIIIRDCDFSYIGGGYQYGAVRFGNGVQFWDNANNNIVERNTFDNIYDAAVTNQGDAIGDGTNGTGVFNIYIRNNIITNSEFSFEYWAGPRATAFIKNIYFENNTCLYAGGGWGHSQRPDPNGRHLMFYNFDANYVSDFYVRNNIFYEATESAIRLDEGSSAPNNLSLDYNCYYGTSGNLALWSKWTGSTYTYTTYTYGQFSQYQADTGKDANSIAADPLFYNLANKDYHLTSTSPCRDTGTTVGVTADYDNVPRPQGSGYDIGAYEYISNVSVTLVPDSTSVPQGGTLGYTVTVTNNTASSQTFQYWTYVTLPNGSRYPTTGELFGPVAVTLTAGQTKSAHLTHGIPTTASLGTYTYYGNVGTYPTVWDADSFTFTVTSTLSPAGETRKEWELIENGLTRPK